MGVPFLHIKHEFCSLRAYAVIVCRNWKLIDKRIGIFLLQILGQLQFYGHPSLIIAQVPDTFSQNSINHRPYFILSAPDGESKSVIILNLQFLADVNVVVEIIIVGIDKPQSTID